MNVYRYFNETLGTDPDEASLKDLPLSSPCGQDCKRVIDKTKELLEICDSHDEVRQPIIQGVNACIEILWLG